MAKTLTREDANEILRSGRRIFEALRELPDDVDPRLAADGAKRFIGHQWKFARRCNKLPIAVISQLVSDFQSDARDSACEHRPIALLVSGLVTISDEDDAVRTSWNCALQVILDLNTSYGWGSKQRKEKIRTLASDRQIVQAIRVVAVSCEDASLDVLAVLANEGSAASVDALIPHFDRALQEGGRLEQIRTLEKHANRASEAVISLLASLDERSVQRNAQSPAIALASSIGIGELEQFWFRASVSSTLLNQNNVPQYQMHVSVDSSAPIWYRVNVTRLGGASKKRKASGFDAERVISDDLQLGRCNADQIPEWIARLGSAEKLEWAISLRTSVRGKKRGQILAWLRSG